MLHSTNQLESLYEMALFISETHTVKDLLEGFTERMVHLTKVAGLAIRWNHPELRKMHLINDYNLSDALSQAKNCAKWEACLCNRSEHSAKIQHIPLTDDLTHLDCARAGFNTVYVVPLKYQEALLGGINLFYNEPVVLTQQQKTFFETLGYHLVCAMQNFRMKSIEKEALIYQERSFVSRELHDSIAQSLAFLKIHVGLLREQIPKPWNPRLHQSVDALETGVKECYNDVRELLLHFRTRANGESLKEIIYNTVQKFEHQFQLKITLQLEMDGRTLDPDVQIQVLHILQEAISNVRKHAQCKELVLKVQASPQWVFEVSDKGIGFDIYKKLYDSTHVGIAIMQERAERIDARLNIHSVPGEGTLVQLKLPAL